LCVLYIVNYYASWLPLQNHQKQKRKDRRRKETRKREERKDKLYKIKKPKTIIKRGKRRKDKMMKNKKAAFEMSITTIIIIVIAVVMLILGLVFVRTIMCGALNIATTTLEGAQGEINKLFGEERGEEVTCIGVRSPLDIVPGAYNIVGCGFQPSVQTTYTYSFNIKSAKDINGQNIDTSGWVTESLTGTKTVGPGTTEYATFAIRPSDNAPEGLLVIDVEIRKGGQVVASPTMRLNIKRVGWLQQSVC
jgi:hypothetical protein